MGWSPYGGYDMQAPQMPYMPQYGGAYAGAYNNTATSASQPQAQSQNTPSVMYVSNVQQIKEISMKPGSKAIVIVQNDPIIAMLESDNMGLTNRRYFNITEFNPDAQPAPATQNADYITRAEFEPIQKYFDEMRKKESENAKPTDEQHAG